MSTLRYPRQILAAGVLTLGLVASGLMGVPAAAAAGPEPGPHFNTPTGTYDDQRTLLRQVLRAINASPRGSTIRGAVYSFASGKVTDALIRAHKRGVRVRVIVPEARQFGAVDRLRKKVGTSTRGSFVRVCANSCRGSGGEMHMKFWSFYKTGKFKNVVMVGSNNLTDYNHEKQWNDLYVMVRSPRPFQITKRWFEAAKHDRAVDSPGAYRPFVAHRMWLGPISWNAETDPIMKRLRNLSCEPPKGRKAPRIRIATHGWNGKDRGRYLAHMVADKARQGCIVRIVFGVGIGSAVRNILTHSPATITNGDVPGIETHQKLMVITNAWYRKSPHEAWVGSMNWSDRGTQNDDVLLQIMRPKVAIKYGRNFERMWREG